MHLCCGNLEKPHRLQPLVFLPCEPAFWIENQNETECGGAVWGDGALMNGQNVLKKTSNESTEVKT